MTSHPPFPIETHHPALPCRSCHAIVFNLNPKFQLAKTL
uniref:Uncharacterized protein n=1 Tax=Anguilla anguilla TaxID=7936 RepID=A0A0E9UM65_ANGAN